MTRPLYGIAAALLVAAASGADAETLRVEVKGLKYSPASLEAHVGDVIEWVNKDFVVHTATARNGAWDVNLPAEGSGHVEAKTPGLIEYYCRYHPNMTATVKISPR